MHHSPGNNNALHKRMTHQKRLQSFAPPMGDPNKTVTTTATATATTEAKVATTTTAAAVPTTTSAAAVKAVTTSAAPVVAATSAKAGTTTYADTPPPSKETTAAKEKATQVYNPQTTVAKTTTTAAAAAVSPSVVTIQTSAKGVSSLPKLSASAPLASASGLSSKSAATQTSSMSTGSIAGIAAAAACFLIAILALFFCIRKKNRRARRAQADEKYGRPGSMYTSYGAAMENDGMGAATVERKTSFQSYNSRENGGPRPPTMIESGRAGMGAGRPVSPVPPMPNPSGYYASPSGPGTIPLPSTPVGGAFPAPQVFAIGSVIPPPQLNQPPIARASHPQDQQQFYSSAPRPISPPAANASTYGYGAPEPQMYQQQPQQYYPQQHQQSFQPQQFDYGGAPVAMDPYGQGGAFATSPGAYPQASPIDRAPPPPAFIPQQQAHQQVQHQQQQQQPQRVQQHQQPQPDLGDAYGGM